MTGGDDTRTAAPPVGVDADAVLYNNIYAIVSFFNHYYIFPFSFSPSLSLYHFYTITFIYLFRIRLSLIAVVVLVCCVRSETHHGGHQEPAKDPDPGRRPVQHSGSQYGGRDPRTADDADRVAQR